MSNEKSTPKTKGNTIKSAPKNADRAVKNAPKTVKAANAVSDVKSVVKTAAAKQVMELKHTAEKPAEQSERPENYAVDTVEERGAATASAAVNTVHNAARKYVSKKYQQHRAEQSAEKAEPIPEQSPTDNSVQQLPEHNQPKTTEGNKPKTADTAPKTPQNEQARVKSQKQAAVKIKENYTAAHSEPTRPKTRDNSPKVIQPAHIKSKETPVVKTKEHYTAAHTEQPKSDVKVKTKEAYIAEHNKSVKTEPKSEIKVKTKDAYISTHADTQKPLSKPDIQQPIQSEKVTDVPKSDIPVKTKEQYIHKQQTETKTVKSANISDKAANIKTKENYIRQHTVTAEPKSAVQSNYRLSTRKVSSQTVKTKDLSVIPVKPKTAEQARKEYVVKKLKTKADAEKRAAQNISEVKTPQPKTVSPETTVKTASMENPIKEQSGKLSVKTKENYIKSIRTKPAEIVKTPYNRVPKQNTHTVTRSVQTSSKAVHIKEKASKNAVKNSRNIFKASRTAKQKTAKAAKKAVKTQKQAAKAAKKAAQQAKVVAQKTAQTAKATAQAAARVAVKVAQAVAAAAKALVSAIAAAGPVAVVIVILIVIIIVAAIVASPLGITISEEVTDAGTVPLSQIIAEYNVELTDETENVELSVTHNTVEVIDNRTDNNIIIAVFAAKLAGAEDNTAEDVVIFDDVKAEKLKEFFRAANTVSYSTEETTVGTGDDATTEVALTITVTGKTKDELMDEYSLTTHQREAVEMLLANGDILTSTSHSLAITDADVQSIINGLPASLPQKRKDVVKNAGSLVGKVNYFWGGKSSAIGWDSSWGTMQRVTAAGSPSSGTIRAYGLDCSGYVTWAFHNSGMYPGDGTIGQRDRSVVVSASAVQAGDLCFLPSYSHVGIVVGKDASGNILVFHCSSSANNVVLSTASSVGFTVFRRPNCY